MTKLSDLGPPIPSKPRGAEPTDERRPFLQLPKLRPAGRPARRPASVRSAGSRFVGTRRHGQGAAVPGDAASEIANVEVDHELIDQARQLRRQLGCWHGWSPRSARVRLGDGTERANRRCVTGKPRQFGVEKETSATREFVSQT